VPRELPVRVQTMRGPCEYCVRTGRGGEMGGKHEAVQEAYQAGYGGQQHLIRH
jgi:hypothetical protein